MYVYACADTMLSWLSGNSLFSNLDPPLVSTITLNILPSSSVAAHTQLVLCPSCHWPPLIQSPKLSQENLYS